MIAAVVVVAVVGYQTPTTAYKSSMQVNCYVIIKLCSKLTHSYLYSVFAKNTLTLFPVTHDRLQPFHA